MICRNCGHENADSAALCENCGAPIARRTFASPAGTFAAGFAGLVAGVFATGFLWFAGAEALNRIGRHSNEEYFVSQGAAWFYVATLVAICVALVVLFRRPVVRKMNRHLRTFLLAALFVMLGGMSLCSFLSSTSLFLKA